MLKQFLLLILLLSFSKLYTQFQFTGNVNDEFKTATAYLSIVDDCNKKNLFLTEFILQESNISDDGKFTFKGDFLEPKNRIYKIHIDNCNDNISDYKHLLNHCEDSKEILFIANNTDKIHFPLNDLSQILCSMQFSNPQNMTISKIDSLQEHLLGDLRNTKNDVQRKFVYKDHFLKLQKFSQKFNEPLAELYTYYLYANDKSLSREYYLTDLKKSTYYNNLLIKLETNYPNTTYTNQFKDSLIKDQYSYLKSKSTIFKFLAYGLGLLLLVSLFANFIQLKKNKKSNYKNPIPNYKIVLTSQEQKVFELMQSKSNKEIADTLFVSLSTIKTHINSIYSKLSIGSRKEIGKFF